MSNLQNNSQGESKSRFGDKKAPHKFKPTKRKAEPKTVVRRVFTQSADAKVSVTTENAPLTKDSENRRSNGAVAKPSFQNKGFKDKDRKRRNKKDTFQAPSPNQKVGVASRAAAAMIINAVGEGMSMADAVPEYCQHLDARDTAFVKEIVYGTLRNRRLLMTSLQPYFEHKLNQTHNIIQALLMSALYQLVFLKTPAHAVVSASVSACNLCHRRGFEGMVNAILNRFLREGAKLVESTNLAVKYSISDWLLERLQATYGEKTESILQASNTKAPLFIRVENSKISTQDYLAKLQAAGLEATTIDIAPSCLKLSEAVNVSELPNFSDGLCSVQDLSAQLAAQLLDLENAAEQGAGLRILDCCCAPGGKSAHILDLVPKAQLVALDIDSERLEQTKSTLNRLRRKADLRAIDAQELAMLEGEFDYILVDAPCSGTGVIRRHPDIKWLRRAKDIEALAQVQSAILDSALTKLKVGGILVYTTCSILSEENSAQVEAFLKRHQNVELKPFKLGNTTYTSLQRLPGEQDGDGFFYARFVKTKAYSIALC